MCHRFPISLSCSSMIKNPRSTLSSGGIDHHPKKKKLWLCQMKTNVWQFLQKSLSFVRTIQRLIGTQQFCMSRCSMEELEGRKRMENDYNSNQTMCRVIPHVLRQLIWENEVVTLLIRVSCRSSFIQKKKFITEGRQFLLIMKYKQGKIIDGNMKMM